MDYAARREIWERCWSNSAVTPAYFTLDEFEQFVALRTALFDKYLRDMREISEFGCGTGHNLAGLARSGVRLRGFDWAESAVKQTSQWWGVEARHFDMLHPDREVKLTGAMFTVHALEQLGADWEPFLKFIYSNKPLRCLHIEPIEELYDPADPHDAACLEYHRQRGYLTGYLTRLRELAARGMAEGSAVR